eukprot:746353-Hanusia_phi.AAC.3
MDESYDVMVLFYSASAQVSCTASFAAAQAIGQVTRDFWPYWKKTAERFHALKIDTLKVLLLHALLLVLNFIQDWKVRSVKKPASRLDRAGQSAVVDHVSCARQVASPQDVSWKGEGSAPGLEALLLIQLRFQVRPIMLWAQEVASIKFEFPNDTPHLDDEQRKAYLVQIKERDERVGAERAKKKAERIAQLKEEDAKKNQDATKNQPHQAEKLSGRDEL